MTQAISAAARGARCAHLGIGELNGVSLMDTLRRSLNGPLRVWAARNSIIIDGIILKQMVKQVWKVFW